MTNAATLRDLLRNDIVTVTFKKKDGTKREMLCTLIASLLPEREEALVTDHTPSDSHVTVWDLEKSSWRAFRMDSLISVETDDYIDFHVQGETDETARDSETEDSSNG